MKQILFFHSLHDKHVITRSLFETGYFFEAAGFPVVHINLKLIKSFDDLNKYLQKSDPLFFYTYNLLGMDLMHKGKYFYDYLEKPVYSTIDTPLNKIYRIKNSGINTIYYLGDMRFSSFITRFKPVTTSFIQHRRPLLSNNEIKIKPVPYSQRPIDILFAGRIAMSSNHTEELISNREAQSIISRLMFENEQQVHEIEDELYAMLSPQSLSNIRKADERWWHCIWNLICFVRCERRVRALSALAPLAKKFKIVAVVDNIEKARAIVGPDVRLLPFLPWDTFTQLMRQSKCLITSEPYHIEGMHEKSLTAMCLGTTVFTDTNPFIKRNFRHQENVFMFDMQAAELADILENALQKPADLEIVGLQGRETVLQRFHPRQLVELIVNTVQKFYDG